MAADAQAAWEKLREVTQGSAPNGQAQAGVATAKLPHVGTNGNGNGHRAESTTGTVQAAPQDQHRPEHHVPPDDAVREAAPITGTVQDGTREGLHGELPKQSEQQSMSEKQNVRFPPCTDAGNAEVIAASYGQILRYDHKQGRWLLWDKNRRRWYEDKTHQVLNLATAAARARRLTAARLDDVERSKKQFEWSYRSEYLARLQAALEIAKSLPPISDRGEGWDADPWLFGVANGVVDLRTGKVREERQDDRITMRSPVVFDPRAQCPRFDQFLAEIFRGNPELIPYLQRVTGYCLTASTKEQCLFCFYGPGANGKSTLCGVLQHIFGDYWTNLPFSALEMKNRNSNDLAALHGARLATAAETTEGSRLNEGRVKALTGGDPITAKRLYHNPFTFSPRHKLVLAFNHRPIIADDSEGMWRRVRLVPFLRQFKPEEQDKNLLGALMREAPGILAWAVQGCLEWQRQGLGTPHIVTSATDAYREESDHVGEFLEDCCVLGREETTLNGELWQAYLGWAERNHEIPLTRNVFGERLQRHGCSRTRDHKGRYWKGIGLREVNSLDFSEGVPADRAVQ